MDLVGFLVFERVEGEGEPEVEGVIGDGPVRGGGRDAETSRGDNVDGGQGLETLFVVGGVACNRRLREVTARRGTAEGIRTVFPSPAYCTDNAVMIAGLGWQALAAGQAADWSLDASPR